MIPQKRARASTRASKCVHQRAKLYADIRAFFAARSVIEVETPLLCQYTVTDPHIESFAVPITPSKNYYLQTSPEYAMKRLLSAGNGSIYQITKSFRAGECGHQHNPEFSMLEWYRVDFNHHDLMHELDELLQFTAQTEPAEKISYEQLFLQHLNINPLTATTDELKSLIAAHDIDVDSTAFDHDTALQILLSHCIEPKLGIEKPLFLYDFPPTQAALSIIRQDALPVAERFELYIDGSEIANGFHELTDPIEQKKRFEKNQQARKTNQQRVPDIDHYFMDALTQGLPPCAGVAVGLDRLLMKIMKTDLIREVVSFDFECA